MTPDQIVAELAKSPLHSVDEAEADAPKEPGFYAWWCDVSALSRDLPMVTHEGAERALLYVGVAPSSAQSRSNLRKRLRQHTGGAIGSSTFRRGLAALVWERKRWQPVWASTRPGLKDEDLAALSKWQRENLRVRWCEVEEPWRQEAAVIAAMRPPMNLSHNEHHKFRPAMTASRSDLKKAAERSRRQDA